MKTDKSILTDTHQNQEEKKQFHNLITIPKLESSHSIDSSDFNEEDNKEDLYLTKIKMWLNGQGIKSGHPEDIQQNLESSKRNNLRILQQQQNMQLKNSSLLSRRLIASVNKITLRQTNFLY